MRVLWTGTALFLAAALALLPLTAFAVTDPDALTISGSGNQRGEVYRDLLETGDLLVLVEYNIAYTTLPGDNAGINFLARLVYSSAVIGSNTPYAYNDSGYGYGVVSIYLTAAQTNTAGLTDGSGVYAAWPISNLSIEFVGNPTITFDSGQPTTSLDFVTGDFATDDVTELGTWVIDEGNRLETLWGVTLMNDAGNLLDTNGTAYFTRAIPALRDMNGGLFTLASLAPNFGTPVAGAGGVGTFAETARDRFVGTIWLTDGLNELGSDFGLPAGALPGLVVFAGIVALIVFGGKTAGQGGALIGFAVGAIVVLPTSMAMGFAPWAFSALAVAFLAMGAVMKLMRENLL